MGPSLYPKDEYPSTQDWQDSKKHRPNNERRVENEVGGVLEVSGAVPPPLDKKAMHDETDEYEGVHHHVVELRWNGGAFIEVWCQRDVGCGMR